MSLAVEISGNLVRSLTLNVPWTGVWMMRVEMLEDVKLSGSVTVAIGDSNWTGEAQGGRWSGRAGYIIRGGAAGWRKKLKRKGYHNDAGVQRSTVAQDAASEAGERISIDASANGAMGPDYAREPNAAASRVLDALWPETPWWVDETGLTKVGPRQTTDVTNDVELLDYSQSTETAWLRAEDVTKVLPGCYVTDTDRSPDGPITIRDASITIDAERGFRCEAYCGTERRHTVLVDSLRRLAADPVKMYRGIYRYRVVGMRGDRISVQSLKNGPWLPDLEPVGQMAGVAGASSQLTPGAIVYLGFADGDPSYPIVVGYTRVDESNHKPVSTKIDVTTQLELGASATKVKLAGGSQPCSRSDRCNSRFAALESHANTHFHSGVTTGSGSSGTATAALTPGQSVAADKVDVT